MMPSAGYIVIVQVFALALLDAMDVGMRAARGAAYPAESRIAKSVRNQHRVNKWAVRGMPILMQGIVSITLFLDRYRAYPFVQVVKHQFHFPGFIGLLFGR